MSGKRIHLYCLTFIEIYIKFIYLYIYVTITQIKVWDISSTKKFPLHLSEGTSIL